MLPIYGGIGTVRGAFNGIRSLGLTAQFLYSMYNMSSKARGLVDKGIDKAEPAGLKALDGIRNIKEEIRAKLSCPFGIFGDSGGETGQAPKVSWQEPAGATEDRLRIDALEISALPVEEPDEIFDS